MPQRNGQRSSRGRSAIARKVIFGGTNGTIPKQGFFGGIKKGGSIPSATGFMRPTNKLSNITPNAKNKDFLFVFKTQPGKRPFGFSPYA